jgi:hypothetical protein
VSGSLYTSVPVGSAFNGTLYYDSSAIPIDSSSASAAYNLPQSFILSFGGSSITGSGPAFAGFIQVYDNVSPGCPTPDGAPPNHCDTIDWSGSPSITGPLAAETLTGSAFVRLNGPANLLTSTALPDPFPSASQWTVFAALFFGAKGDLVASGTVTSVTTVPEPATFVLITGALIVLAFGVKDRRTRTKRNSAAWGAVTRR